MAKRDYVAAARDYAKDVVAGRQLACKYVRLVCRRFLSDLKAARGKGFHYRLDVGRATKVCEFVELMPHIKGKWALKKERIHLEPWQCFIIVNVFGWVSKATGLRRYRRVYVEVPRKNAKSTTTAAIANYMLVGDGEHGAEVYSGATTEKQAWEVFSPARLMALKTPELIEHYGIDVGAKNLNVVATASKLEPIIGKPGDGASPSFSITDEYHEHQTSEQYDTMVTGMGSREEPIAWVITTAGSNTAGPCYALRQQALDSIEGKVEHNELFGIVYTIDSVPTTVVVQSLQGLQELDILCTCRCVPITQIGQFAREVFAKLATVNGAVKTRNGDARHIQIDPPELGTSAVRATSNGSSNETPPERNGGRHTAPNGRGAIDQSVTKHTGAMSPSTGNDASSITTEKFSTESAERSTTGDSRNSTGAVQSADGFRKLYVWITATAQKLFGDSSAGNATRQSAFSAILSKTYNVHSPTCKARDSQLNSDGTLSVVRPPVDWTSETALRMANPNMGVSVFEEFLRTEQQRAVKSPREQSTFKTKHLNVWVTAASPYFNAESWNKLADPGLKEEDFALEPCAIGLDLASTQDIAGYVKLFRREIDGKPHSYVFPKFYVPQARADEPTHRHYAEWVAQGYLTATPANSTDFDYIEADIKSDGDRFPLLRLGFDPWNAAQVTTHLQNHFGQDKIVQVPQTVANLSFAMKEVQAAIDDGRIHHAGNPAFNWMIGNVTAQEDRNANVFPRKESPERKIDGALMLIIAMSPAIAAFEVAEPMIQFLKFG